MQQLRGYYLPSCRNHNAPANSRNHIVTTPASGHIIIAPHSDGCTTPSAPGRPTSDLLSKEAVSPMSDEGIDGEEEIIIATQAFSVFEAVERFMYTSEEVDEKMSIYYRIIGEQYLECIF